MTKIIFFEKDKKFSGFQVKGHANFADKGFDIVCSAVSVACQMAVVQLKEVLNLDVNVLQNDGFLNVNVLNNLDEAQSALKSLKITLENIAQNYSKFVKLEVKKDVY